MTTIKTDSTSNLLLYYNDFATVNAAHAVANDPPHNILSTFCPLKSCFDLVSLPDIGVI